MGAARPVQCPRTIPARGLAHKPPCTPARPPLPCRPPRWNAAAGSEGAHGTEKIAAGGAADGRGFEPGPRRVLGLAPGRPRPDRPAHHPSPARTPGPHRAPRRRLVVLAARPRHGRGLAGRRPLAAILHRMGGAPLTFIVPAVVAGALAGCH